MLGSNAGGVEILLLSSHARESGICSGLMGHLARQGHRRKEYPYLAGSCHGILIDKVNVTRNLVISNLFKDKKVSC